MLLPAEKLLATKLQRWSAKNRARSLRSLTAKVQPD
jgi:hypothetical protein